MINNVGIIGVGAIGSVVMEQLYNKYSECLYVIANGNRAQRIRNNGILINDLVIYPQISEDFPSVKMDLVIICVKNYDLKAALKDIRSAITDSTIIMPLLNGVTSVELIREYYPQNQTIYGIIMRTDANRVNHSVTCSEKGEIQIGTDLATEQEAVIATYNFIKNANININIYDDIKRMQWRKWMVNIGANQVSVVARAEFKYFGMIDEIVELMHALMKEIVLIGQLEGVNLDETDIDDIVNILIHYPPHKKTSMLQDIEACRQTEIDYFAGEVVRRGQLHGLETPYNRSMYLAIKALEKVYLMRIIDEK